MARLLILIALVSLGQLLAPSGLARSAHAQAPAAGTPVLLDFSIPGCIPCRQMEPVIARLHQEGFAVRQIDASQQPQVAAQFRVQKFPTLVLLAGGRELWRAEGAVGYEQLRSILQRATPSASSTQPSVQPAAFDAPASSGSASKGMAFQVGSDLGPASPPPAVAASSNNAPTPQQLLNASVRLRVEDPAGHAFGTGTIIDTRQGEALVLTCGHLFRGQGQQPALTVELFDASGGTPRVVDRAPGQVLAVDLENDVALVSLKPNRPVTPARVAASLGAVTTNAPVWSVGCDLGADPTVRSSRVVGVNRTHRPPNVSSTGAPVQGRSGGGLFNAVGELVGVCFGADNERNEGLYADLVSIHAQLDKLGLTEIYRNAAAAPSALASAAPVPASSNAADSTGPMVPVPPPIVRAQNDTTPNASLASLSSDERAALQEIGARAAEAEVICIVRPKTAGGRSEVISLDSVSPAFLQALRGMQPARR